MATSGAWTTTPTSYSWGGSEDQTSETGDTASFTFTGKNTLVIGDLGPHGAKATLAIDGTPIRTIDEYSTTTVHRVIVAKWGGATSATHTLTLTVKPAGHAVKHGRFTLDGLLALHAS